MNRTVWAVAITVGIAGTSWAGPPGGFGYFGDGHAPAGFFGLNIQFGGFGYGNYGRGVGVSLSVPLHTPPLYYEPPAFYNAPSYYYPPSFYSRPYPPVPYAPSGIFFRSPAATPGGSFFLPEFTDPDPPRIRTLPAPPRAVPADPPSFSPVVPRAPVPGTFRYDGDPVNPVPLPNPDVRPPVPAPRPGGDGEKMSLPGRVSKQGYGFPVYGAK